mmetsp:Transcript_85955/g.246725  ORF Transcript_85955/g.246725 Transcript_85955/m.246725 type:complete len:223 (+) Transcript_85955:288-956(+)
MELTRAGSTSSWNALDLSKLPRASLLKASTADGCRPARRRASGPSPRRSHGSARGAHARSAGTAALLGLSGREPTVKEMTLTLSTSRTHCSWHVPQTDGQAWWRWSCGRLGASRGSTQTPCDRWPRAYSGREGWVLPRTRPLVVAMGCSRLQVHLACRPTSTFLARRMWQACGGACACSARLRSRPPSSCGRSRRRGCVSRADFRWSWKVRAPHAQRRPHPM